MTYTCFDVSVSDQIAHIQLTRPEKRNAMSPVFWDELPAIVRALDADSEARVIVISSTGPHFSSGLDVAAFFAAGAEADDSPDLGAGAQFYDNVKLMQDTFSALESCRLPVLVAIQGGCIGGGMDMVTACDMRYASKDAYFTIMETKIGMTADVGTFPRILNHMPEGMVRELSYTGRKMSAEEALKVGLINQVFEDQETMLNAVMEIAKEIAANAPLAVYGCKHIINYSRDHNTADALDYIGIWNASMLQQEQMAEAMAANMQKRPGKFEELPKRKSKISAG